MAHDHILCIGQRHVDVRCHGGCLCRANGTIGTSGGTGTDPIHLLRSAIFGHGGVGSGQYVFVRSWRMGISRPRHDCRPLVRDTNPDGIPILVPTTRRTECANTINTTSVRGNMEHGLFTIRVATDWLCVLVQHSANPQRGVAAIFKVGAILHVEPIEHFAHHFVFFTVSGYGRVQVFLSQDQLASDLLSWICIECSGFVWAVGIDTRLHVWYRPILLCLGRWCYNRVHRRLANATNMHINGNSMSPEQWGSILRHVHNRLEFGDVTRTGHW